MRDQADALVGAAEALCILFRILADDKAFGNVHAAVDDHSRLAYAEVLPDEQGATAAAFLLRQPRSSLSRASEPVR